MDDCFCCGALGIGERDGDEVSDGAGLNAAEFAGFLESASWGESDGFEEIFSGEVGMKGVETAQFFEETEGIGTG